MPHPGTLLIARDDSGVVTITFNRPQVRNALDWATMEAFAGAVHSQRGDATARVVILTGAGTEAFCSGGDLRQLASYPTEADGARLAALVGDALRDLERLPIPVIAAINGLALGGGSEIALACDLRIADETAQLGLVHLRLALIPGWGAGQRLLRLVGYSRAMQIMLSARPYGAAELHAMGVVNHVTPPGEALAAAREFAAQIAESDAAAVRAVKALLHAGLTLPHDEALMAERKMFPPLWAAKAHLDAVARFVGR